MGEVTPLRPAGSPRRTLFTDERGAGLRITWHPERDLVVLSLGRDDVCVGTFRLTVADAHRLVEFLTGHLAQRGSDATRDLGAHGTAPASAYESRAADSSA
jgi:hypothetical protein